MMQSNEFDHRENVFAVSEKTFLRVKLILMLWYRIELQSATACVYTSEDFDHFSLIKEFQMFPGRNVISLGIWSLFLSISCWADEAPFGILRVAGISSVAEPDKSGPKFDLNSSVLEGLATVDTTRPWALAFWLPQDPNDLPTGQFKFSYVKVIPTKVIDSAVKRQYRWSFSFGQKATPKPVKLDDNLYQREDAGQVSYILLDGDTTFVSSSRELIEQSKPKAVEWLKINNEDRIVSVIFDFQNVGKKWKDFVEQRWRTAMRQAAKSGASSDDIAFYENSLPEFLHGCKTIELGADGISAPERMRIWLSLSAIADSGLDDFFKQVAPIGSRFSGRVDPAAALNVAVSCRFGETISKPLVRLDPKIVLDTFNALHESAAKFKELEPAYDSMSDAVATARLTALKIGRIDAVYSHFQQGRKGSMSLVAPGAERIDEPLRTFLRQAKTLNPTAKYKADVAKTDDVQIHCINEDFYVAFMEDVAIVATDISAAQKAISTQTSLEQRQKTPAILVEGDLSEPWKWISSIPALEVVAKALSTVTAPKGEERFRIAVEAKEHTLTADFTVGREVMDRAINAQVNTLLGPFAPFFRQFQNKKKSTSAGAVQSTLREESADAQRPVNSANIRRNAKGSTSAEDR